MINVIVFSFHRFEEEFYQEYQLSTEIKFTFLEVTLSSKTAQLAKSYDVVCCFANDKLDKDCLDILAKSEVKLICTRSAGFNHIDIKHAGKLNIPICRVPGYSPYAIAEHAMAMYMTLNRKIHKAYNRTKENNFSLDGLVGEDLHGKTIGVLGTGKIGEKFCNIALGFGCRVIAYDLQKNKALIEKKIEYHPLDYVLKNSDIISIHLPLNNQTHHILNSENFSQLKESSTLINTSRGSLVETEALISALKQKKIKGACLDVYEEEENVFFFDYSDKVLMDDKLSRLLSFPNVLITSHQGFLTKEALTNIATTTVNNIQSFFKDNVTINEVKLS